MDRTAAARAKRYRDKKRDETVTGNKQNATLTVTKSPNTVTATGKSVTVEDNSVTPYHPILRRLVPGKRREKMEAIIQSLKGHRAFGLEDVYFGAGKYSIGMSTVEDLLEATG